MKHPRVSGTFGAGMGVINDIVLFPFIPAKIIAKLPDIYVLCLCKEANPAYENLILFCNYNIETPLFISPRFGLIFLNNRTVMDGAIFSQKQCHENNFVLGEV